MAVSRHHHHADRHGRRIRPPLARSHATGSLKSFTNQTGLDVATELEEFIKPAKHMDTGTGEMSSFVH